MLKFVIFALSAMCISAAVVPMSKTELKLPEMNPKFIEESTFLLLVPVFELLLHTLELSQFTFAINAIHHILIGDFMGSLDVAIAGLMDVLPAPYDEIVFHFVIYILAEDYIALVNYALTTVLQYTSILDIFSGDFLGLILSLFGFGKRDEAADKIVDQLIPILYLVVQIAFAEYVWIADAVIEAIEGNYWTAADMVLAGLEVDQWIHDTLAIVFYAYSTSDYAGGLMAILQLTGVVENIMGLVMGLIGKRQLPLTTDDLIALIVGIGYPLALQYIKDEFDGIIELLLILALEAAQIFLAGK